MNPILIVLVISLIGNAALTYAYLGKRDTAVAATVTLERAGGDVRACNSSVDSIAKQGAANAAVAAPARQAAQKRATELSQQADAILTAPPAVPGDDCKSVQARANDWFREAP